MYLFLWVGTGVGGGAEVGWFSDWQVPEKQEAGLSRQSNGDLILPIIFPPPLSWKKLEEGVL